MTVNYAKLIAFIILFHLQEPARKGLSSSALLTFGAGYFSVADVGRSARELQGCSASSLDFTY